MANTYCTATHTGKGFWTHKDRNDFYLSGHPGDVYAVGNTNLGISWINRVEGTAIVKADAQAIVDSKIEEDQAAANLANLIGDEAKKMIQAVHKGKWRIVKQAYSNIGKLIK